LAESEEKKIAQDRQYRTPARQLRRFSAGHIVYELPGARQGFWDGFQVRNLGLAVSRRMAAEFGGDAPSARAASVRDVARALDVRMDRLGQDERRAFENLALVLALIDDLESWTGEEKRRLFEIIRAKAGAREAEYARLMQNHERLRESIRRLGV
jgi:hypothetical protein